MPSVYRHLDVILWWYWGWYDGQWWLVLDASSCCCKCSLTSVSKVQAKPHRDCLPCANSTLRTQVGLSCRIIASSGRKLDFLPNIVVNHLFIPDADDWILAGNSYDSYEKKRPQNPLSREHWCPTAPVIQHLLDTISQMITFLNHLGYKGKLTTGTNQLARRCFANLRHIGFTWGQNPL